MRLRELKWKLRHAWNELRSDLKLRLKRRREWNRYWQSYSAYQQVATPGQQPELGFLYPCLGDDQAETPIDPIYFYQDSWAFEQIFKAHPPWHLDVGSHHKFVALLSKALPVTMVDLRPLALPLDSLRFQPGSILNLPYENGSVPSVSSLCVIEHVGLGRYGDALDPDGSEKAIVELKRVVQSSGQLYLSVPLDDANRVYFNAHRAFTEEYLFTIFAPFEIVEKRYIYGKAFLKEKQSGFGVGCYQLKAPAKE